MNGHTLDGSADSFNMFAKNFSTTCDKTLSEHSFLQSAQDEDESDGEIDSENISMMILDRTSKKPRVRTDCAIVACSDGNIKANYLLSIIRNFSREYLAQCEASPDYEELYPATYFASVAGKFSKWGTSIDKTRDQKFEYGPYTFGGSSVEVEIRDDDRMYITDPVLQRWITQYLGLPVMRWDLVYQSYGDVIGCNTIISRIKEIVTYDHAGTVEPITDRVLGTMQYFCAFPLAISLYNSPYESALSFHGGLRKFLDFLNALMFAVEGSRNFLVFYTGLICLQNMRYNNGTTDVTDFSYDDLFSLFPLSARGTGKGNFSMEKALHLATTAALRNHHIFAASGVKCVGFRVFRKNSDWLKTTVRSAVIVHNELVNNDMHIVAEGMTRCEFVKHYILEYLLPLFKSHYNYNDQLYEYDEELSQCEHTLNDFGEYV